MEDKKIGKKILKIALIVLLVLITILLIHTIRNYIIVSKLQNNFSKYKNSTNYYIKSVAKEKSGNKITTEYYKKGGKEAIFIERIAKGEITKMSIYNDGQKVNTYVETKDSKVAKLDTKYTLSVNLHNQLESDSKWQTFLNCISARIKSTKYNDINCYEIQNFFSRDSLTHKNSTIYVDSKTGLVLKAGHNDINAEKQYKFDSVEDLIFKEPDITKFVIK